MAQNIKYEPDQDKIRASTTNSFDFSSESNSYSKIHGQIKYQHRNINKKNLSNILNLQSQVSHNDNNFAVNSNVLSKYFDQKDQVFL